MPRVAQNHFYPRSPCGERPLRRYPVILGRVISIHALLAESDNRFGRVIDVQLVFLSTLSLRRATMMVAVDGRLQSHFYPRSPCGERRHSARPETRQRDVISIHALLAESDVIREPATSRHNEFLSTLSLRRATNFTVGC